MIVNFFHSTYNRQFVCVLFLRVSVARDHASFVYNLSVCLSVCCFTSRSRKCRAYGDVTFADGGLQSLARTLYTSPLIKEGSLSELCYVFLFVWCFFCRFWCLTLRETIRSSTICVGVNARHGEQGKRFYSKLWIACMERGNTIAALIIKISQYKCSKQFCPLTEASPFLCFSSNSFV